MNHWAGVTASAILVALITASWKMPPIQNETKAQTISDLFKFGRYVAAILYFIEFYDFIISIIVRVMDWIL
jgi:hypothetical protein